MILHLWLVNQIREGYFEVAEILGGELNGARLSGPTGNIFQGPLSFIHRKMAQRNLQPDMRAALRNHSLEAWW